jgi:hypothetical protein
VSAPKDEPLLDHLEEVEQQEETAGGQRKALHKEPFALVPNAGNGTLHNAMGPHSRTVRTWQRRTPTALLLSAHPLTRK